MGADRRTTEREVLTAHLARHRRHILGAVEGLSQDEMTRPVLPSGWTCAGLVQHLALDVEAFWFRCVLAGDEEAIAALGEADAWQLDAGTAAADVVEGYRREIALADAVIADAALDAEPAWWPDFFGEWRLDNAREVLFHVVSETATHAGHLDAARELIDRKQWLVLD